MPGPNKTTAKSHIWFVMCGVCVCVIALESKWPGDWDRVKKAGKTKEE